MAFFKTVRSGLRDNRRPQYSPLQGMAHIRDLGQVIKRENAAIGVFITLEAPTKPMLTEATEKGFYHSPGWNKDYPRLQILTVEGILAGKQVDLPPNIDTFKKAQQIVAENKDQGQLEF
jgi:site-specific DNA-methyltransferase (adenine-specific)